MAQQIQFYYVTQSEYDGLTNKNAGGLHFTSHHHGIIVPAAAEHSLREHDGGDSGNAGIGHDERSVRIRETPRKQ